jgi:DNA-binding response OmpR family regulator
VSDGGKIYKVRFESFDDFLVEYSDRISRQRMGLPRSDELQAGTPVRIKLQLPSGEFAYLKGQVLPDEGEATPDVAVALQPYSEKTIAKFDACIQGAMGAAERDGGGEELRLLLVDDLAVVRIEIGDALRDRGVKVRVAENGLAAISAALKRIPDVILSDVQMPQMDGWTLLRMVRARDRLRDVPFVFFTRLDDDLSRLQGYRMGVDDYLAKDTSPDEVLVRIRGLVSRHRRSPATGRSGVTDALAGDLRHVRLGSLLSFLETERRTGYLRLDDGHERVELTIVRGSLFDIDELGPYAHVRDRVFDLLDWQFGEFEFMPCADEFPEDAEVTQMTYLLLEHARRLDEANAPEEDV